FEAKLENSPGARAELESMEVVMGMLSKGLKNEWCSEMHEPNLEVLPEVEAGKVITPVQFIHSRRLFTAAAAVVAAACLVGAALFSQKSGVEPVMASIESASAVVDVVDPLMLASVDSGVAVPQLFLAEEIDDLASLDLAESLDDLNAPVDATYLEASSVIPASHSHTVGSAPRSRLSLPSSKTDRVDSYLPPVDNGVVRYGIETGLIEQRTRQSIAGVEDASRVIVRGYVSMDGGQTQSQALAGFRPVSVSGNPVISFEKDLEVISNFQSIQRDLGTLAESLSEGSDLRLEVEALYERNKAALRELKQEFVR
ncbi:MAG: hypothetical protein AAGF67_15060, partial [Verrucomicrobiota bacterium]